MNANLAFWLYAYVLTVIAVAIGFRGIFLARRGELARHGRHMRLACNLILFFAASYLVKVFVLGREDKSDWSAFHFAVLMVHESFIFIMLIAGGYARWLARQFGDTLTAPLADLPEDLRRKRRRHAVSGKLTITCATLALATAAVVVQGMFARM